MEKYHVLARRFRPQKFNEVVGQESVVTILKNAMRHNRVSHAYLFSGMRGIGKTTLARILAKALNCQSPSEDLEPCGTCTSCKEISECRSLDVIEIDGASNRGIDDIRKINETVFYAPASGKYKIYIIDEVHMLTKEAFNALLKTLEAPPENVKFFFATTEIHKVLPTILSRTQRLELKSVSFVKIAEHLESIAKEFERKTEREALLTIASHAEGSLRDALSLFDQVLCYTDDVIDQNCIEKAFGLIPTELLTNLDQAIENNSPAKALSLVDQVIEKGKDLTDFVDALIEHYRKHLHNPKALSEKQVLFILDKLIEGQIKLQKSPSKRACVELLLINILEAKHVQSLASIAKRLIELEKQLQGQQPISSNPIASTPVPAPSSTTPPPAAVPQPKAQQPAVERETLKVEPPKPVNPPAPKLDTTEPKEALEKHSSHYDTLMKFSEVELEGIIHKD